MQKEKVVSDRRGPGKKKKVMILAKRKILKWGNILEIRLLHRDEGQGMPKAPWPVTPATGDCEQLHSTNRPDFLPNYPTPAGISLQGRDVKSKESSTKVGN